VRRNAERGEGNCAGVLCYLAEVTRDEISAWLLAGDPAIAWQVERDLLQLPAAQYERTRRQVAERGWGARLLAQRGRDGLWASGLYNPKWTSTFYSLQLLSILGVGDDNEPCVASCRRLLDEGVEESGAVRLWRSGPADTCVTGMLLAMAIAFGLRSDPRTKRMLDWLLAQQMSDGGWNCRLPRGATHASFHTTTTVLEALQTWSGSARGVRNAAAAGREFMLVHRLYRSHRTGAIARQAFTQLCFPHWWKFDVLRGLEHFRAADKWDERLADPLALIARKRGGDGRWKLQRPHPGRTWFALEPSGKPSRWNTLRALRVLEWAEVLEDETC
jgi:hypothetical protein